MKMLKNPLTFMMIGLMAVSLQACKTKKIAAKPTPPVAETKPEPVRPVPPAPPAPEKPAPAPEKPNYNFRNVLFEFDSGVLKTASFETLDQIAREMKKDPSVKFILHGHSSVEGSAEHNMSLSNDRANSVKSYLINAGISANNLTIKAHGSTQPTASNSTEEGRAKNRRVEFEVQK
ncbi:MULTISPECIES: OmpA family protein [Pedobacter]|uniref:OmpA family protein n=1 Tax=Pedobacter TaxID=84567 RepID=UPI00210D789F|nr:MULTISPECIES: OmpA family protein [unclassified Pedobacter]